MPDFISKLIVALGSRTNGGRDSGLPPLVPLDGERIRAENIQELHVLVSSPVESLKELRELLFKLINRLPGVEPHLFELGAVSGDPAKNVCKDLVDKADIVVVLIGNDAGTLAEGTDGSFSKYEYDRVRERQQMPSSAGRPRVLVYKHRVVRELSAWETQVERDYGAFTLDDAEELAARITIDVAATLLAERKAQAEALSSLRNDYEQREYRRQSEISGLKAQAEAAASALIASGNATKGTISALAKEVETLRAAEATRDARVQSAKRERNAARAAMNDELRRRSRHLLTTAAIALGVGVAIAAVLLNASMRGPSRSLTQLIAEQTESARAAVGVLGSIHKDLSTPAALILAKIRIAKSLNLRFNCAITDHPDWWATDLPEVRFSREEVCESYGSLVLRITSRASQCGIETMSHALASELGERLRSREAVISSIRIIGHASSDSITGYCTTVPDFLLPAPKSIAIADKRIRTNTQLAWARAAYAERQLRAVFPNVKTEVTAAIGVLGQTSIESERYSKDNRRVDIELLVDPRY